MRLGVVLSPVEDWSAVVEAAQLADDMGLDSLGLWDHYHSPRPEWGYVSGWSAYGYLAAMTGQIRLVPNVLNGLHYELGVLAKESSMLAIASGGRFELGIGAGDWPESFAAWGEEFPAATERLARLEETVVALRQIWQGQAVTMRGTSIQLAGAICTPAPPAIPRVVVGVGASMRTLRHALRFADEVNLYAEPKMVESAQALLAESARDVSLSVVLGWEMENWPDDVAAGVETWVQRGVQRLIVNVGGPDMLDRIRELDGLQARLSQVK